MKYIEKLQPGDIKIQGAKSLTVWEASKLDSKLTAKYIEHERIKYLFTHCFELITEARNNPLVKTGHTDYAKGVRRGMDRATKIMLDVFDLLIERDADTTPSDELIVGNNKQRLVKASDGEVFPDCRTSRFSADEAYANELQKLRKIEDGTDQEWLVRLKELEKGL